MDFFIQNSLFLLNLLNETTFNIWNKYKLAKPSNFSASFGINYI